MRVKGLTKRGGGNGYKIFTVKDSRQLSCNPWPRLKSLLFVSYWKNEAVVAIEIELL